MDRPKPVYKLQGPNVRKLDLDTLGIADTDALCEEVHSIAQQAKVDVEAGQTAGQLLSKQERMTALKMIVVTFISVHGGGKAVPALYAKGMSLEIFEGMVERVSCLHKKHILMLYASCDVLSCHLGSCKWPSDCGYWWSSIAASNTLLITSGLTFSSKK